MMRLSKTTKRILVWGPLTLIVLLLIPGVTAYLEYVLFGTAHVEDGFRRLGIHHALMRFRDWLLL